ncbi:ATP-binding protein [Pontiella desulfatans]|nr:ATP-binding protein [Pontiella desulfatans]
MLAACVCCVWPCRGAIGTVESLAELAAAAAAAGPRNVAVDLEATVLWSSAAGGRLILHDAGATLLLELDLPCPMPAQGDRFRLEGECAATRARDAIMLAPVPVVENNGLHALDEQSGEIHLEAGRHPVQVFWFNRTDELGLEVEYEGPGMARLPIPDAVLFRDEPGTTNQVNGLEYRCYEGHWWRLLPNFDFMSAVHTGVVHNFDAEVRTRDSHVGVRFGGHIQIPQAGDYTFHVKSDDGSRLFIGPPSLKVTTLAGGVLPAPQPAAMQGAAPSDPEFQWAEIEGSVVAVHRTPDAYEMELMTKAGLVRVRMAEGHAVPDGLGPHARIRTVGVARRIRNLAGNWVWGEFYLQRLENIGLPQSRPQAGDGDENLPVLTTIGQVYQLSIEESSRMYPVKVRGVVTSPMENNGAVLQDSSRGIYVALNGPIHLQVGDYCEIEGTTGPYRFSPYIEASRVEVLGAGSLPEPVEPSWDQLINGSLHCNYVELEGVVASVGGDTVALLTRGGRINVRLNPSGTAMPPDALGATVRLRGCLRADWDAITRRVLVGSIFLDQHWVSVVEPAPADPFAVSYKKVGDLLQFDPLAGALHRIRVWGTLIHKGEEVCCLLDGGYGLRFLPIDGLDAEVGDMVDVSGFLELGGTAPVLREAITRRTEHGGLPAPARLPADHLVRDQHDATFVKVEGVLLGISAQPGRHVLELQNGLRRFEAGLDGDYDLGDLATGSLLELTGAYIGLGGDRVLGRPIDSFKLLLNSAADIVVLSRPPWWTLERLLSVVGLLAAVLVAAAVWITSLRRTVEQRTAELGNQIRERQRAEHDREIEQERARVAHDLHDDLGARLTEVNMLASLVGSPYNTPEERRKYADQMKSIALHMVTSLDEIVWAVNPRNDKVSSLAGYFGAYAQRVLELASIKCGLDIDEKLPSLSLDPVFRREVFLAFKEALANIIQHSRASKVWLRIGIQGTDLVVVVSDDGSGFMPGERKDGADGLANMTERLAALHGECAIESDPEKGTTVRLQAPIPGGLE